MGTLGTSVGRTTPAKRGTLECKTKSGPNNLKFSGRIGSKKLKPGRYRATITATATGTSTPSAGKTASFTIVRR